MNLKIMVIILTVSFTIQYIINIFIITHLFSSDGKSTFDTISVMLAIHV